MREKVPDVLEKSRIRSLDPRYYSGYGEWCGMFTVKGPLGKFLNLIVSRGDDGDWAACGYEPPCWEHVSVSVVAGPPRLPQWEEMKFVKELCWDDEELVVQFHPRKSEYRDCHPWVLHLWKVVGVEFPRPPADAVGPSGGGHDYPGALP